MGYIFAGILAFVVVLLLVDALVRRGSGGARTTGGGTLPAPHSPIVEKPAADAPTPDRSVTARGAQVDEARRHTPPA